MDQDLNLDLLLQETLALSEFLRSNKIEKPKAADSFVQESLFNEEADYLMDLADSIIAEETVAEVNQPLCTYEQYPESPGIIYKIDNGNSTFCVRGFSTGNIRESMRELSSLESVKRPILKLMASDGVEQIHYFPTKNLELADAVKEQIINRRFPHLEDSLCNISDPGFSWWMNLNADEGQSEGRFEIFFRSHGINRAEKYIQLGPIGDGAIAALRMNQARTLLRSSFPISEFSCDDKSFAIASSKPDHSGFISFKNIFLEGVNQTTEENFPDNSLGRTLYFYFHELAIVRKFWIEVKNKVS